MAEIKLAADSGGGSISIKGPSSSGSDLDLLDTSGNLHITGNIGIGETDAEEALHITHASAPGLQLEATSGGPYKSLIKMGGNDMEIRGSSGNMEFFTGNADGDSSTERMRIKSNEINVSSSSYVGSFTSSSGSSPTGLTLSYTGVTNQQVTCNSTGYECNVINNISGSGHSACIHQYRTLNVQEGSLHGTSSGLAISNNSDYRKKERITDLTGSLEVIDSLRPRQYYYRDGFGKPTRAFAGFIAHELQSTDLPHLTTGVKDAVVTQANKDSGLYKHDEVGDPIYQTVAYTDNELITHLVNAVKELKAKVAALEAS